MFYVSSIISSIFIVIGRLYPSSSFFKILPFAVLLLWDLIHLQRNNSELSSAFMNLRNIRILYKKESCISFYLKKKKRFLAVLILSYTIVHHVRLSVHNHWLDCYVPGIYLHTSKTLHVTGDSEKL